MKIVLSLVTIFVFAVTLAAQSAPTVDDYLRDGKDFYTEGKYQSAIKQSTLGLKLAPRNTELLTLRAESYLQKGNLALSLADCNKAIAIDSRFSKAYKIRGAVASKQINLKRQRRIFKRHRNIITPSAAEIVTTLALRIRP